MIKSLRHSVIAGAGYWHAAIVFILCLAIYLVTMPLTVALEDDGLFIMSGFFNGVSHPPGYPLHALLGKLFTLIPAGSIAARVHALGAVFGALTCVLVWHILYALYSNKAAAYTGALLLAFSERFWSQAIIAEVYTLNTFLFFALFYVCLKIFASRQNGAAIEVVRPWIYFAALLFGLALSNHWPLIMLASPALLLLVGPDLYKKPKLLLPATGLVFLGLLPYVWMVYNSNSGPLISFTGPIDSWHEFIRFISRERYAGVDQSTSADFADKLQFLWFFATELFRQFSLIGSVLLITGLLLSFSQMGRRIAVSLIIVFLGTSVLLILLLGFDFDAMHRATISVYFLPAYAVAGIFAGTAINAVADWLQQRSELSIAARNSLLFALMAVSVISTFVQNYQLNNRHDYDWGAMYAHSVLELLPQNAVLVLHNDIGSAAVGYTHYVENVRPDVRVVSVNGLVYSDRLFDPRTISQQQGSVLVEEFIKQSERPVYTTSFTARLFARDYWLVRKYDPAIAPGQSMLELASFDLEYLRYILEASPRDKWSSLHRRQLINNAILFIVELRAAGNTSPVLDEALLQALGNLDGLVLFAKHVKARGLAAKYGGDEAFISLADKLYADSQEKTERARYHRFMATLALEKNDVAAAMEQLRKAIEVWPNRKNPAIALLLRLYESQGMADMAERVRNQYR